MGELIQADFKIKLSPKLSQFDPNNGDPAYHEDVFCEMFPQFPQFKAHVAAYVERHYCTVINDEDHPTPKHVIQFLKEDEVRMLNDWILTRGKRHSTLRG